MPDSDITDLTVLILRDIRDATRSLKDEVRGTNERLDTLTGRVDTLTGEVHGMSERLDVTNQRLAAVEHTVRDAASQFRTVGAIVTNKHEKALDSLRKRVSRLEAKAGSGRT